MAGTQRRLQRPNQEPALESLSLELRQLVHRCETHESATLARSPAGHVFFVSVTQLAISATEIRRALRDGRSIRYLVPAAVEQLIEKQHIYA